jgi:hypothetical protein
MAGVRAVGYTFGDTSRPPQRISQQHREGIRGAPRKLTSDEDGRTLPPWITAS